MAYKKRYDGRKEDETREIKVKVGVIPRADGSAEFSFGDTKAIAAVYGPRKLHPKHLENPEKGILRCTYDLASFSVDERKRPGLSRRSQEISHVITKAFNSVVNLDAFPNTVVDVIIEVFQADASTRCAGINAASIALAHAGVPMNDLISSVSMGKIGDSIVADLTKKEEDYEEKGEKLATDIPIAFSAREGKITLLQADGKVGIEDLKKAIEMAENTCKKITEIQKKALKELK